jgi:transcriptional regulator with XRE-family HTH domain
MANSRIKQLRLERGWSLKELASELDITESHLSRVEAGKRGLQVKKLEMAARLFKVPVADLMNLGSGAALPDLTPYAPPKGSFFEKAYTSSTQKMFKVTSNCLNELGITEGDPIVVETTPLTKSDLKMGDVVVVEVGGDRGEPGALVLRQFLGPNLLVTNSSENNAAPIHMVKARAKIIGRVLQ